MNLKRKKIFILTGEPPDRPGGVERFVSTFVNLAQQHGYEVKVFHRENSVPSYWQYPRSKAHKILVDFLISYFIGIAARKGLNSSVQLVLSNGPIGWYPLGNKVKQAHFYHGTYRGQAEAIRPFISYKGYLKLKWWDAMVLEKWSGRGKIVLCCSELVREEVLRFFGYEGYVVWYPIDLNHFRPMDQRSCRRRMGVKEDRPVGLFVGSTHPMKGFPMVEHLVSRFSNVQWLLALRGEVPEKLRNRADVKLFQNATYDLLPILYNTADFSLCPSLYDSFSYVVAEALSSGTPVIASPCGASIAFHSNTSLKPLLVNSASDIKGFEQAVCMVLSDPARWRRVVQNEVRPILEELMAPENWWRRFCAITGL